MNCTARFWIAGARARTRRGRCVAAFLAAAGWAVIDLPALRGQTASSLSGTVEDSGGQAIPGAMVSLSYISTGAQRATSSDARGEFLILDLTTGDYRLDVGAAGFASASRSFTYQGAPIRLEITLSPETVTTEVSVIDTAVNAAEPAHVEITPSEIEHIPTQSLSSPFSSLVTQTTPGVSADSNGQFHPLGDHAEASFVVDGQPITDQQSRTFSTQVSLNALQAVEVKQGAPSVDIGDKTSMVIVAQTKSGLDQRRPHGGVNLSRGTFHTTSGSANVGFGTEKFGSFTAVDVLSSGRFLDAPELKPLHANGNAENLIERLDYTATDKTHLQLNLTRSGSWFQTPNTYDQQAAGQNQRQTVSSFNIAPQVVHVINPQSFMQTNVWVRQDKINYLPSGSLYSDTPAYLEQRRRLTNAGARMQYFYTAGRHNLNAGVEYKHTFLSEQFATGLTDPVYNSPCLDASGGPSADVALMATAQCGQAGLQANPKFLPGLLAIDLTRGGQLYSFQGATDIRQEAAFVQDDYRLGNFTLLGGLRFDNYNGLANSHGVQPRAGIAYRSGWLRTSFHANYSRVFLTPYNENLIVASSGGPGSMLANLGTSANGILTTASRNQYNTGFVTHAGAFSFSGEYFWKFTRNAYDFDVLLNTPLTFPTQFRNSKIDGGLVRMTMNPLRGFSGFFTFSHVRSRLFGPQVGGISFSAPYSNVVRPDHDQGIAMNLNLQYQFGAKGPWINGSYRYDGGLVAVAVPNLRAAYLLTGDEQQQMGLHCGSVYATVSHPIRSCAGVASATRIRIPPQGTENDDTNPARIAVRNIVDLSVGMDNLFRGENHKVGLRVDVVNLNNVQALYNFLSTFSGTHFLTPRTVTGGLRYQF